METKIYRILGLLWEHLRNQKDLFYDAEEIWSGLTSQGYSENDIAGAVSHIEKTHLELPGPFWSEALPVHRCYTDAEMIALNRSVRGYLWRLKCRGVIDHALEDEIVHKVMNLDEPAGIRETKTVAALTVFGYEHRANEEQNPTSKPGSYLN